MKTNVNINDLNEINDNFVLITYEISDNFGLTYV